jgi:Spy/CpxP family protein refolding chaperone
VKNIRTAVAALLVIAGTSAVAAAQQNHATPSHAHGQRGQAGPHRGAGGPGLGRALLRGITLSDAEKANLKTVRAKYAPQAKAIREQFKPQHEALRAARQAHDTTALKALREKSGAEREAMQKLMVAQQADLRAALSPENQAKFDANVAKMKERVAKRPNAAHKRRPGGR